jgi:hypothetical protein
MPDAAQVQIINTALGVLGQEPVAALDEASLKASLSATKLMRHIEAARDAVLARHGWTCALEYVALSPAAIGGYVNWRYPTVYYLPGAALRVWEIEGVSVVAGGADCWGPRWQRGTVEDGAGARQVIRAQSGDGDLNVAYVRRANWTALDTHVADAVAYETAARGAYSVTADQGKAMKAGQAAEARILLAISVDGTQEGGQPSLAPSIPAAIRASAR